MEAPSPTNKKPQEVKAAKSDKTVIPKKPKKSSANLKYQIHKGLNLVIKFQVVIIAVSIGLLLAITALRMISYSNPSASDEKIQQNLSKLKKINIDPKVVERIEQLSDTQTSTNVNVRDSRNNPFSE